MDNLHLSRIDLNLLVTFSVLYEELNVTKAAGRLFLTQSALSRSLGRLRDLFDDPLFTRHARGLVPTPKSDDIAAKLPNVLTQIDQLINTRPFDPQTESQKIRIALPEQMGQNFFAHLIQNIHPKAPNLTFEAVPYHERMEHELASGQLDFAFQNHSGTLPHIDATPMGHVSLEVIAHANHPLSSKTSISLKQLVKYPFILGFGSEQITRDIPFIRKLSDKGLTPQVIFQTDHLVTAFSILENTQCLMPSPSTISSLLADNSNLTRLPLPRYLTEHQEPIFMLQHQRTQSNPLHTWLQPLLVASAKSAWQLQTHNGAS